MISRATRTPALVDPDSFGEDLVGNFARVGGLAEKYCPGCGDYHVIFAARRVARSARTGEADRAEMARMAADVVRERLAVTERARVIVAATSDTGMLAVAAHGVATLGRTAVDRTDFIVVDRCRTPLALCETFAARHSLNLGTEIADLTVDEADRSADLVIVHSLLRQLPAETHVGTMRRFARWIAPEGRLIFSHRVESDEDAEDLPAEREETLRRIREGSERGTIVLGEPIEAFAARLGRRMADTGMHLAKYRDVEAIRTLIAASGFSVVEERRIARPSASPGVPPRERLVALCAAR